MRKPWRVIRRHLLYGVQWMLWGEVFLRNVPPPLWGRNGILMLWFTKNGTVCALKGSHTWEPMHFTMRFICRDCGRKLSYYYLTSLPTDVKKRMRERAA